MNFRTQVELPKGSRNPTFGSNHAIWFLFCGKYRKFVVNK